MKQQKKIGSAGEQAASESDYHVPVLAKEAIEALQIQPDGVYVDCTFGGGGHTGLILEKLSDKGRLIAFDQDEDARQNIKDDARLIFVPQNFRHLARFLKFHKYPRVDGILADLGVSSHQFDEAERGFSTRFDASLDMRMDQRQELTAATILKTYSEKQLHKLFEQYGEISNSKTLARTVVEQREHRPLNSISQFKDAIHSAVKGNPNKYLAQVFQAVRIEVNDEIGALRELLMQSVTVLKPGGRVVIITFHSLEDRLVKNFFKHGSFEEAAGDDVFGKKPLKPFLIITKKPIVAGIDETRRNARARSAKLRVAQKPMIHE
jgi:16S rRNA (cytosine1402-N4)-methyltransferase